LVPISTAGPAAPRFLLLEELIAANLHILFPGATRSIEPWQFRVTRDADVEIREDEADDLLHHPAGAAAAPVRARGPARGPARLPGGHRGPPCSDGLELTVDDTYRRSMVCSRVDRLSALLELDLAEAEVPDVRPRGRHPGSAATTCSPTSAPHDVLLHHPFESFAPVVDFVRAAATRSEGGQAIKQTLYRTSGDSPSSEALEEAIDNDKQVAAVVELKARFDEQNNIGWARRLEEAGVHVVYGVPGLKTHAKMTLVVRREKTACYAATPTSGPATTTRRPRGCTPTSALLTADPGSRRDVADLFNRITGFGKPPTATGRCSSRPPPRKGCSSNDSSARRSMRRTGGRPT
jgi:polyphosphate kinase